MKVCPHPFLDELEGPCVLGDLEQLRGLPFLRGKAAYLLDHVSHTLGILGEAPVVVARPRLAHAISHLVAFVEANGHGPAQSHGPELHWGPEGPDGGGSYLSKTSLTCFNYL